MKRTALMVLIVFSFACSLEEDEKPTVSSVLTAEATASLPACDGTVAIVGEPVRLQVRASWVTTSCMCEDTTRDNGWSCSDRLHCESEYNRGAPNPTRCDTIGTAAVAVQSIDVTVDRSSERCAVQVEPTDDVEVVNLDLRCPTAHTASIRVRIRTERGETSAYRAITFTRNGVCPALPPSSADAGEADAGEADTGEADAGEADAGDAGEADSGEADAN